MSELFEGLVHTINRSWLDRDFAKLGKHLVPDCVLVAPDFKGRISGRAAVVRTYEEFMARADVHEFRESELAADVFGEMVMVTYRFDMTWTSNGARRTDAGHELLAFVRSDGQWKVAWRTQVPRPA